MPVGTSWSVACNTNPSPYLNPNLIPYFSDCVRMYVNDSEKANMDIGDDTPDDEPTLMKLEEPTDTSSVSPGDEYSYDYEYSHSQKQQKSEVTVRPTHVRFPLQ